MPTPDRRRPAASAVGLGLALTVWLPVPSAGGCGAGSDADDPLDRARIEQLASARGSATGDARTGAYALTTTTAACDCPTVELDGESLALCSVAELGPIGASVNEGGGLLAITAGSLLLTGAIEADGSFVVAGVEDLSSLGASLELLRRVDGQFEADAGRFEGAAGQRLVGAWATGDPIDCRWTGELVGVRE